MGLVTSGEVRRKTFSSTPGDESTCSSVTVPVSPELQRVEGDVPRERYQKMDVGGDTNVELEEGDEN
jgi:hypothetical protein